MGSEANFVLESGLNLNELVTTGSVLHLNSDSLEDEADSETEMKNVDFLGQRVKSFQDFESTLQLIDETGFVKKKILQEGGGVPLHDECTVSIAYSGYWENEDDPFDVRSEKYPLVVNLSDNGLLPGLLMSVKSMLVGELSAFLISYQVMYGEMGIPPRIKPMANCVFYIKLVKSILTPKDGEINLNEQNMFQRVKREAQKLYQSGNVLYKSNCPAAIQLFKKAIYMLHKCRLADDIEQESQEKLLRKLYINLAICYNKTKQPLKACIACNEFNRLKNIWSDPKVLFLNAKALRMIGAYESAEKRLLRARNLSPDHKEMETEWELLKNTQDMCNQSKLLVNKIKGSASELVSEEFKREVETLIKNFKVNPDLCKLALPSGLSDDEVAFVKLVCIRENVFCNKLQNVYALDRTDDKSIISEEIADLFI